MVLFLGFQGDNIRSCYLPPKQNMLVWQKWLNTFHEFRIFYLNWSLNFPQFHFMFDNQGVIFLTSNPAQEGHIKYIEIPEHYIRECIHNGKIKLYYMYFHQWACCRYLYQESDLATFWSQSEDVATYSLFHDTMNSEVKCWSFMLTLLT